MATPNPIERVTLPVQIANRLRTDILAGLYPGGTQLLEAELALTFGVSRGPLREAMQRLVQEGLLRSAPHRGVFVTEVDEKDLLDVYFVREALETAAIRKICSEGRQAAVADALAAIAERMDKALKNGDTTAGGDLDFEFHRTLVDAAKSERLSRTYATVQAETRLCLHRLMGGYRSSKDLAEEHFRLAETIRSKNINTILSELRQHFGDPASHLRKASGTALT
ncbi:GntR family transcriptional regulator [Nisaea sp.]|uniref:GntR family transcriptional regulator n=1 Tax=Nisaea sp. TaxID=2024842 RepID=UPI002B2724BC|nr:GntR family transcriptional regulator [Nisaea sp.]